MELVVVVVWVVVLVMSVAFVAVPVVVAPLSIRHIGHYYIIVLCFLAKLQPHLSCFLLFRRIDEVVVSAVLDARPSSSSLHPGLSQRVSSSSPL